jgi:hypothetical protein
MANVGKGGEICTGLIVEVWPFLLKHHVALSLFQRDVARSVRELCFEDGIAAMMERSSAFTTSDDPKTFATSGSSITATVPLDCKSIALRLAVVEPISERIVSSFAVFVTNQRFLHNLRAPCESPCVH